VGLACFALLAPSSSFVPIASEVGADRRMYLPLALLLPLLLALGARLRPRGGAWPLALVALVFAGLSAARAAAFRDPVVLWQRSAEAVPGNARARYNLAGALERAGREEQAAAERARALAGEIAFYTRILPLQPDRAQALGDLAALHVAAGELARAEARYAELVALAPDDADARRRLELVRERLAAQKHAAPE
jgi:tetratricopeptide (TPR) repeat protein